MINGRAPPTLLFEFHSNFISTDYWSNKHDAVLSQTNYMILTLFTQSCFIIMVILKHTHVKIKVRIFVYGYKARLYV